MVLGEDKLAELNDVGPKESKEMEMVIFSNPIIDPGDALKGRFWASQIDDECDVVKETPYEEMGQRGESSGLVNPVVFYTGMSVVLVEKNFLQNIRVVCGKAQPCLILLSETKCGTDCRLKCLMKLGFDGLYFIPSMGHSGGIVAAWKSVQFKVEIGQVGRQLMHMRCDDGGIGKICFVDSGTVGGDRRL
ncbi:hypothetical protein K1719_038110 [Acacia pycnantha]|nr:hypothetical protein K1719_038110 [Acacia pycnantha]